MSANIMSHFVLIHSSIEWFDSSFDKSISDQFIRFLRLLWPTLGTKPLVSSTDFCQKRPIRATDMGQKTSLTKIMATCIRHPNWRFQYFFQCSTIIIFCARTVYFQAENLSSWLYILRPDLYFTFQGVYFTIYRIWYTVQLRYKHV